MSTTMETKTMETKTMETKTCDSQYERIVNDNSSPAITFKAKNVCYFLEHQLADTDVQEIIASNQRNEAYPKGCRTCIERQIKYVGLAGVNGPAFSCGVKTIENLDRHPELYMIYEQARKIASREEDNNVSAFVVSGTTFPKTESGGFHHTTVFPDSVTDYRAVERCTNLQALWKHKQIDSRLSKLLTYEARLCMQIITEEAKKLIRAAHWTSVCSWVQGLYQQLELFNNPSFDDLTEKQKIEMRFFAIMTGRTESNIHLDYQQSANLIDFLIVTSREELRKIMDSRSDPSNYMQSALIRRLAKENITSPCTISLVWSGEYTDDLDIHVYFRHIVIYFGNKSEHGCTLDFDANVTKGEAEPCENVSVCPGTFVIKVNNFTRRTYNKSIPFQIICREVGKPDCVYDAAWTPSMQKGDLFTVCSHTFGEPETKQGLVMSDSASARTNAQNSDWVARVGTPDVCVETFEALSDNRDGTTTVLWEKKTDEKTNHFSTNSDPNTIFMSMVRASQDSKKKQSLWENCQKNPTTFQELLAFLKTGSHSVQADGRNFTPGYYVNIATTTHTRKDFLPVGNTYDKKFSYPVKPVKGTIGTARFDNTWTSSLLQLTDQTQVSFEVHSFVQIRGLWFAVFKGAAIPLPLPNTEAAFPLGGGFYPVDLSVDFHQHRERWSFFHMALRPAMPVQGTPLVGSFLLGTNATFTLDGQEITVSM